MAYEGWFEFNGTEIMNAGRTVELSRVLGIDTVRLRRSKINWIETAFDAPLGFGHGGFGLGPFGLGDGDTLNYRDITQAPWYDAGVPASMEFAGALAMDVRGLEGSNHEGGITEYVTTGGHVDRGRAPTLSIVANVAIVARTERGAEYGLRWLNRALSPRTNLGQPRAGSDLTYFRYADAGSPKAHRRGVRLTRGSSITRKKTSKCATTWFVTFTLTAADPHEYGEEVPRVLLMGPATTVLAADPGATSGTVASVIEATCPVFDYSPIYDPNIPALLAPPTAPEFLPIGWNINAGMEFRRYWARVSPPEPSGLLVVPKITLGSDVEARRVRISIWPSGTALTVQCEPLFSVVVNYVPANTPIIIDGERQMGYAQSPNSPYARRVDSLLYSPSGGPVQWTSFSESTRFLVTLDNFRLGTGWEAGPGLGMSLSFIPKSD